MNNMKTRCVAKYEYFGSNMSWINKISQFFDFFVHFRFDINPLSHEFFLKNKTKFKRKSSTLKGHPGRKNGRREPNFGYVIGYFLTFKKAAASHRVIFNGFWDIRPRTHHGVFVHLKGEYDLKG